MSSLIIEVCQIDDVLPHSGADRLQLAIIKGWQCVIKTNEFTKGQKVIYCPPDSVIPTEVAKKFDKEAYLGSGGRVKVVKLRGEASFGLILPCENDKWSIGKDVADIYGITKYVPQVRMVGGKNSSKTSAAPKHPLWQRYTEIEHLRNYPDIIPVGQEVIVLEKIHGHNQSTCILDGQVVIGSRNLNRKEPTYTKELPRSWFDRIFKGRPFDKYDYVQVVDEAAKFVDGFWMPYTHEGVKDMLKILSESHRQVQLFSEVYGPVQGLNYGSPEKLEFRAFDLLLDGRYAGYDYFSALCRGFDIPTAPVLYRGPYSFAAVKAASNGQTLINAAGHMREGGVVKCVNEFSHPKVGRAIFKCIGDEYYLATYGKNPPTDVLEE